MCIRDRDDAWDITTRCVAYTKHTIMAEALEKWPIEIVQRLLPRVYQIVDEINRRFVMQINELSLIHISGYFIIALINSTIGTWTYALPLVIAAMIYLDIKMMMVTVSYTHLDVYKRQVLCKQCILRAAFQKKIRTVL